jgi:hypothetical protein
MNLTLGNTFPRTWKRFNALHIAAAAAIALGLSVALAAGITLGGDSASKPSGPVANGAPLSARATQNGVTYYIVDSQAEATRLDEGLAIAAAEAAQPGYESVLAERIVPVVIETPEQELQFQAALMALQQSDLNASNARIVDLRR